MSRPDDTAPLPRIADPAGAEPISEGRAARRRAQQQQQRKGGGRRPAGSSTSARAGAAPQGRAAMRRARKAQSMSSRVITATARGIGELAMTIGVILVLFVVYTQWWTNVVGRAEAKEKTHQLEQQWNSQSPSTAANNPGVFSPGKGFALLYIPKISIKVPIEQGTDKEKVLNQGVAGHYTDPATAMPWDPQGNFGVAAHRNTHGEPFRHLNKVGKGDVVVVETADDYFTYVITNVLPQTSPYNVSVLDPIPVGSGFTAPGRYITLTTCTPDGTSWYRLIEWGVLQSETPRSAGKPAAVQGM